MLENPALATFLAKDQPLIDDENVIESWDAEWAGAFLGGGDEQGDSSMRQRRKQMMMESGKKSAALLNDASGKLSEQQKALGEMEAEKSALHTKLMELSGDLRNQIGEAENNVSAMTDLVNALKMYETKINGEHKKSSQQLGAGSC